MTSARAANATVIQYRGVNKQFDGVAILDRVDLAVTRGEIVALVGPSGSGKTVLLKMLVGLVRPDAGQVLFKGADVAALDERALAPIRRRIGFVFQSSALFDSMTVEENVGYPLRVLGRPPSAVAQKAVDCLSLVGLPSPTTRRLYPSQISGGMRKRVAVARALATDPEVLLYDEPTVGLDPTNVRLIGNLIVDLRRRHCSTALVVSHDEKLVFAVADRIVLIGEAHIAWSGTRDEARRSPEVTSFFQMRC